MHDIKNYVVLHYNQIFHSKENYEKETIIHDMFSSMTNGDRIKEIAFNNKDKPKAYIYFSIAGLAKQVSESFRVEMDKISNQYQFKANLGDERVNRNMKSFTTEEAKPKSIIFDENNFHGRQILVSSLEIPRAVEDLEKRGYNVNLKMVIPESQIMRYKSDIYFRIPTYLRILKIVEIE